MSNEYVKIITPNVNKNVPTKETVENLLSQNSIKSELITLVAAGWDSTTKQQTININGILADESKQLIIVTPTITDFNNYTTAGIRVLSQAANSLTFVCDTIPTVALNVYITMQNVNVDTSKNIYGVHCEASTGSMPAVLTRTNDAVNFTNPIVAQSATAEGSSPFDNILPWAGMVRSTHPQAGEVVAIPKFYFKITKNIDYSDNYTGSMDIQISMTKHDGFICSPAHMDRGDGVGERDTIYVGRYLCEPGNLKSISGVEATSQGSRGPSRDRIHNLGSTVWQYDILTHYTIQLLYLVEYANWNTNVIGSGNSMNDITGLTDNMKYHTGTVGQSLQYRNIENLWSNIEYFVDGLNFRQSGLGIRSMQIIANPSEYTDEIDNTKGKFTTLQTWDPGFELPFTSEVLQPVSAYFISENVQEQDEGYPWFIVPMCSLSSSSLGSAYAITYDNAEYVPLAGGADSTGYPNLFTIRCENHENYPSHCGGCRLVVLP